MAAESSTDAVKLQPRTSWNSNPSAYIEIPDENTVITAKVTAFSARVFSSKRSFRYSGHAAGAASVIERHHEDAHEQHGRHRADPIEMRGHDAVFRAGRAHSDHFLRAQVGGDERQAGDPDRNGAAGSQKIFAGGDLALDQPADAQYEGEIERQDEIVDRGQRQAESLSACGARSFFADLSVRLLTPCCLLAYASPSSSAHFCCSKCSP